MKKFAVFTFDQYYPSGGWHDFAGTYEDLEEAREVAMKARCDWWHVVDITTGTITITGGEG